MTPIAVTFLVLALTIIWGGLIASTVFLGRRSEVAAYPEGGEDLAGERIEE
ncbi:MetS family NSS transporter small subunit [Leucobacter aridicollis]|uniref:MetS family NSS transporter small subunit n=1 Tax=Leucobacter aridicollis TaxID=283878 RepID=UPI0021026607|nr:MetS family NSS transporter small subunit [Leucobacter aridicollis]UTX52228.1 MetS family NSS transporter small subunit [Leucobacter aridicollis]